MTSRSLIDRAAIAICVIGLTLAATGCAGTTGPATSRPVDPARSPSAIVGKVWQWESSITPTDKIDVPTPERYTLQLQPDGKFAVQLDCNRGHGGYVIDDGTLSLSRIAAPRAACPEGSLDARFARELGRVKAFRVEGGKLYLEMLRDEGTMRFRPGG